MKTPNLFTGSYGLVIRPDAEIQRYAEELSKDCFPKAEYLVSVPHITLYHGRVFDLPADLVVDILEELRKHRNEYLNLFQIDIFGGKFAFWDIEMVDALCFMHRRSLEISRFLDQTVIQRSLEEGLEMSLAELENVKRFGHPLVNDLYRPHITLAYDSHGLAVPENSVVCRHGVVIEEVLFAEMGKFGSVAGVVEL